MGVTKLLLAVFLALYVSVAVGLTSPWLSDAQQCRLQRLTASRPEQRFESEGGLIELWNQNEEQFQCAGVAAMRFTLHPNSVHLPSYHPSPRLVYVLEGRGLLGITIPGCAETFSSQEEQEQQGWQQQEQGREQPQQQQQQQQQQPDQHQKIRSISRGDVIVMTAGAAHWSANHHNQENLVLLVINDLNHLSNLLDQNLRVFYLAGGLQNPQEQQQEHQPSLNNVISNLNPELFAEATNLDVEVIRSIQREDRRGFIVNAQQPLSGIIRPGIQEEEQQQQWGSQRGQGSSENGIEETICTAKFHTNVERFSQADVYSRQAGRLSIVDQNKLAMLGFMDLSVEKGELFSGALASPQWTDGHSIFYVVRGDAQVEAVSYTGENVLNERVNEGEIVVIPQFFAATIQAGQNGFEWVAVRTTGSPLKHTLAGYTSVLRAEPLEVVTQSYQISPAEGQALKLNRGGESSLLSAPRSEGQSQRIYN